MTKFSISKLESARQNPTQFAQTLKSDDSGSGARFSKYMAWQLSVFKYHTTNDLSQAINYFESTFRRNFAENPNNDRQREAFIMTLQAYATEHVKLGLTYVEHKKRIGIDLSQKLKITGEIPLIHLNSNSGYSAYFFTKDSTTWESELKFPIIQDYMANFYGVDLSEVEVGVFGIDNEQLSQITYSDQEVADAIKELNTIGQTIMSII
ncbi:hypothetical protein [Cyclobacterium plantarum]|uniref:hypothetical protein n=1 Tax=Cyclobacterium plantarum TaxID=2716263 RepID=UPI003F72DD14